MANKRKTLSRQSLNKPDAISPNQRKNDSSPKTSLISSETNNLDDPSISDDEEGGTRIGDIYIPPPIQPHCSTESKGPRLIITMISNENFKSYAGKVILGPFHHCFTAIIGPNGSGKSNVIDSMLFVFGYRSNKIRCDKLRKLLHSSTKGGNAEKCCVAVHFKQILDKEGGVCEEIEGSEIIVARTAFYDNSSFYTINGKRVQFKEVSKLLKEHGVDLDHNRFLILQGEVESIAMMKAKGKDNECGMLEYLEDIVGTSRYKEPLIKLNNRVETLTEERTEKHNRCKLAEREMKDLEQPYSEAITYLKLENTLTRTKNLEVQKVLSTLNKRMNEYGTVKEEITSELTSHDEKYDELKKERLDKEASIREETLKYDNLCKGKEELETKLKDSLKNFQEVQITMQETNKRRKQNKTQLEKLGEQLVDLEKVPEKNQSEVEECEKKISNLTKTKVEMEEVLQKNYVSLESCTKPLIEEREILETDMIDIKKRATEAKGEVALVESELKILQHDETTEKRKFETLKSSLEESKSTLKDRTQKLKEIESEIPEFKKEIASKLKEIENFRAEEDCIRTNLMKTQSEITEKVNSLRSSKSNNKVLDSLMRQKNEGKIPGILGRLGDLGAIDSKYDVAISTACGRLDNIVVDKVNTAQNCIEYLKQHNVGRASFIALEKVSHYGRMSQQRPDIPQEAMRLFDLIRVEDERVLSAFYFAIRDTLVAENLDQGTKIAYGKRRYRVVTLNGDLIEISGTMSGGGRTQIRGKMGQKVATKTKQSNNSSMVSQKAVEDLQVQAEELQSRINYIQEEQGRLEREVQALKINLQLKESDRGKLSITINSLSEQLPRIETQLKTQKSRMEQTTSDQEKVLKLKTTIELKQSIFDKSNAEASKLTEKIEVINKKIADIHGEKVKSVQTKINNLTKQIKTLTNNISKLKVESTTSERNFKKIEKQIEDLKINITKTENEIRSLNTRREEYDAIGVELAKQIEEAKENIAKANKDSSHVQKEIIAIQKQESDGKLFRIEIEQKLHAIDEKLTTTKAQIPHFKNQLKPLKLQEIPGETEPIEPLKTFTEEELDAHNLKDIEYSHETQAKELSTLKPNLSCIAEYQNKREVYLERVKFLEDITNKRNEMRQVYDDVRKKRFTEFLRGFHIITKKLKEMYQMITQGGDAELELVDSMDPFTEGVSFSVRPPKKTWKNISNLSGGEKTLSSLALVFALHYYKPSPLYFMDEIDAALDFKNISIVAHYIKERTKNAQFIIISLRSNMFELSDYLVGIYKVQDCTNSVTIKNQIPDSMIVGNTQKQKNQNHNDTFSQLQASNNLMTTRVNQLSNTNRTTTNCQDVDMITMETSSINVSVFKTPAVPPSVARMADTVQNPLTSSLSLDDS